MRVGIGGRQPDRKEYGQVRDHALYLSQSRVLAAGIFIGLGRWQGWRARVPDGRRCPERPGSFRPGRAFTRAQRAACRPRRLQDRPLPKDSLPYGAVGDLPARRGRGRYRCRRRRPVESGSLTDVGPHALGEPRPLRLGCPAVPPLLSSRRRRAPREQDTRCSRTHRYGRLSMRSRRARHTGPSPPCFGAQEASQRAKSAGAFEIAEPETDVGAVDGSVGLAGLRRAECSSDGARIHHAVCQRPRDKSLQPGQAPSRHRSCGRAGRARAGNDIATDRRVRGRQGRLRQCRDHTR